MDNYDVMMKPVMARDIDALEKLSQTVKDFPTGKDDFIGRHWIGNAIDCGSANVVRWMLEKGAPANYRDDEGYLALHSAIERKEADKYEVMQMLIDHGVDVDAHGLNDWTPAHMAACRNDVEALRILHKAQADFSIRIRIYGDATPLEEARFLGSSEAVAYLEGVTKSDSD